MRKFLLFITGLVFLFMPVLAEDEDLDIGEICVEYIKAEMTKSMLEYFDEHGWEVDFKKNGALMFAFMYAYTKGVTKGAELMGELKDAAAKKD